MSVIFNKPVSQSFIPKPILTDHYVLGDGNLPDEILMPDGHGWGKHLPIGETQRRNIDAQSCSVGGTNNCYEAIGNKKFNDGKKDYKIFQDNLSERYGSICMGMTGNGGNPHTYAEGLRNWYGCIPEVFLPFNDSVDSLAKFFSPRPITYSLFKYGYSWKQKYTAGHQWLFYGDEELRHKQNAMKEGLKRSPVGVAGYAWSRHADGKYYNDGPAIHWFTVYDFVEGEYWLALDTYPDETGSYIKKLDWNYNFAYAKSYSLHRRLGGENVDMEHPQSCVIPYISYLFKNIFV